jgi:AcrR family transcriptional regulator
MSVKVASDRTAGDDPIVTLKLLWRRRERPSRGPAPGLDVDAIVRAAVEIADEEGLAAVSMRRVAQRLGAGTMSLYRHLPAKGQLLDLMFDAAIAEQALPDETTGNWRAQLERCARDGMAVYRRHPWMLEVPTRRPPLGPNVMASYEAMLRVLASTGLEPSEVVAAVSLVGSYLIGAARAVVESDQAERRTGVSDERWWEDRSVFWEEFFDPARFPTLAAMWEAEAFEIDEFEFGLQRVLDGIAVLIEGRAA